MTRFVHLLTLLVVNAIPAAGWFIKDWSPGTTLTVYWFENVAACLFVSARIVLHQRWNPRRGHFKYRAPSRERRNAQFRQSSFVQGFLVTSLAFCAVHGLFLAVMLSVFSHQREGHLTNVDWHSVGFGCASVAVALAVDFVVDLPGLRHWPFLQIEQMAYQGLGRVIVVHFTLLIGMFAVAITGAASSLFGVFVALKTLYSLSTALLQLPPIKSPEWLRRLTNRRPKVNFGEEFEEQFLKDQAAEAKRRDRNEEPWAARP